MASSFNVVRSRDAWTLLASAREKGVDAAVLIPTTMDVDANDRAIFVHPLAQEAAERFPTLCENAPPSTNTATDEYAIESAADPKDLCAQYGAGVRYGRTVRRFGSIVTIATRWSAADSSANLEMLTLQANALS